MNNNHRIKNKLMNDKILDYRYLNESESFDAYIKYASFLQRIGFLEKFGLARAMKNKLEIRDVVNTHDFFWKVKTIMNIDITMLEAFAFSIVWDIQNVDGWWIRQVQLVNINGTDFISFNTTENNRNTVRLKWPLNHSNELMSYKLASITIGHIAKSWLTQFLYNLGLENYDVLKMIGNYADSHKYINKLTKSDQDKFYALID